MDKSLRIVIIGGSACGPKAAARARRLSSNAKITILEQGQYVSIATCGLPYFNSGVIKSENSVIVQRPDYFKKAKQETGEATKSIKKSEYYVVKPCLFLFMFDT